MAIPRSAAGRRAIRTGTPACSIRLTPGIAVGAAYAGSRGDFLGGAGRGFFANQLEPRYLALGTLLSQPATAANIVAAKAIVPDVALPYPTFSGTIGQALRPFPQYSAVTDVYGNVAWSDYHSLQLTFARRHTNGLTLNANYTVSRTEDNLAARTGTTSIRTGRSASTISRTSSTGSSSTTCRSADRASVAAATPWCTRS